jgi:cytochrome P450
VRPSPLSARRFFRDPVAYVREHGGEEPVVWLRAGRARFALVRDPQAIWELLVLDAGAYEQGRWKRRARRLVGDAVNLLEADVHRERRRVLAGAMDGRRVAARRDAIARRARELQAGWREGQRLDVRAEMQRFCLLAAGDVLLSRDLGPGAPDLARALETVMDAVPRRLPPWPGTRRRRALRRARRAVGALVAERREGGPGDGDVLDALLAAGVPVRSVEDEVTALLLAAVAEPARALEAACYLLAHDPAAERALHAELDAADEPRPAPFLEAVVRETLRLFPPTRHVDRCPRSPTALAGQPLGAKDNVIVSPLVTHREAGLYERPDSFLPERWLRDGPAAAERARGAYLPFGAGAHACLGAPLARALIAEGLAGMVRRWRLRPVGPDAPAPSLRGRALELELEAR